MSTTVRTGKEMGLIRIIKRPAGKWPDWILDAWLGMELPCLFFGIAEEPERDGKGNVIVAPREPKYHVPQAEALKILSRQFPDTAKWWRERGYPKIDGCFAFNPSEVAVIKEVAVQELRVCDQ